MKRIARMQVKSVTGALIKSLGRKVSLKSPYTSVSSVVGPRESAGRKVPRLRYAVMRKTKAGKVPVLNRKGEQLVRKPTRYAHLAGPKRKSRFVQDTATQTKHRVMAKMAEVMTEALAKIE